MGEMKWVEMDKMGLPWWKLTYRGVFLSLEKRPWYCDRGNWIAKLSDVGPLFVDFADGWPRYYFSLEVAKSECEEFLRKREKLGQIPPNAQPAVETVKGVSYDRTL